MPNLSTHYGNKDFDEWRKHPITESLYRYISSTKTANERTFDGKIDEYHRGAIIAFIRILRNIEIGWNSDA